MEHIETTLRALLAEMVALEARCSQLAAELAETQERKSKVKAGILSLSHLVDSEKAREILQGADKAPASLTAAVREVFKSAQGRLSPADVRAALIEMGYNVAQHTNVLASIHTCLKRLTAAKEIQQSYSGNTPVYELRRDRD